MKRCLLLFAVLPAVIVGLLVIIITCDDNPTKPKPEVSDYNIYFRQFWSGIAINDKFFVYNTKAMALVDTFELPYEGVEPQISADGKYLYIPGHTKVAVVDIATKELITELDAPGEMVVVSPDNRYLAVTGDSLMIFDVSTFEKIFSDTIDPSRGCFTQDSKRFYCSIFQTEPAIYRLDLETEPFTSSIIDYPGHRPSFIISSPDETRLYLISGYPTNYFEVYNRVTDSIEFTHRLQTWLGYITITPDGKYVIYDESIRPDVMEDPPSPMTISVYDVEAQKMKTVIPTYGVDPDCMEGVPAGNLIVTPDGRWLIAGGFDLILVDLQKMEVVDITALSEGGVYWVSCQQIAK